MTTSPTLSVVTVSYNSAATIERTIDSVLSQTFRDLEYIVVDGGSTDDTLDIVRRHGDRIRWISERDGGIYDAMNKGIRLSRGRWIHLLNSDDYYNSRDSLERATPLLQEDRTNYFSMIYEQKDGQRSLQRFRYRRPALFLSARLPHPSLIVSRRQYEVVGLYDTGFRIAADHDLILRLTDRYPGHFHDLPLTVMTAGGMSAANRLATLEEFRQATINNGLAPAIAQAIFLIKRLRNRI